MACPKLAGGLRKNERTALLSQALPKARGSFFYEYDFGDSGSTKSWLKRSNVTYREPTSRWP